MKGFNYRLEAMQGAVLRVKLRHLEKWTQARRSLAALYDEKLRGIKVETPSVAPQIKHVYHIYAIQVDSRERFSEELAAKGIQTNIHYPIPVHLQKAYSDLGYKLGDFPVSETLARKTLSLPLYPELSKVQVEEVAEAVRGIAGK